MGISDINATLYEESLKKGGVLVITRSDHDDLDIIFEKFGAIEIRHYTSQTNS